MREVAAAVVIAADAALKNAASTIQVHGGFGFTAECNAHHYLKRATLFERLCGQLMLALYRSRRQAEATEVYQRTRRRLVDELGLEPGPQLHALLTRILEQDPDLDIESTPIPLFGARGGARCHCS